MIDCRSNVMFEEAAKGKRRFNPFLVMLFFILVFDVGQALSAVVTAPFMVVWMDTEILPKLREIDVTALSFEELMKLAASMPPYVFIANLFSTVFTTIAALIFATKIEGRSFASVGFRKHKIASNYGLGYLIGAGVLVLTCLVTWAIRACDMSLGNINALIILYFLGYIVQGMSEEVLCRGFLMISLRNSIKSDHGIWISVFVSALVFALLHSLNPGMTALSFFNLFLSGLFFSALVLRFDNLWIACAAHAAWNFFQGNIIGVEVSGMEQGVSLFKCTITGSDLITGGSFGFEGGLVMTVILSVVTVLLFVVPGRKKAEV